MKTTQQIETRILNILSELKLYTYPKDRAKYTALKTEMKVLRWVTESKPLTTNSEIQQFIIDHVTKEYLTTFTDTLIRAKRRNRGIVEIRHVVFYLCVKFTKMSLAEIGMIYHKDHTTVIHSIKAVNNLRATEKAFDCKVTSLETHITEAIKGIKTKES